MMLLSTKQTLPNQIPLGPAEMISLLSFSVEWVFFILVEYVRSSEDQGHDATWWWKGLDLSNGVCEYEVNPLTNDKVIT